MESFFNRHRNPMILGSVLLLQVVGLAVQLKRPLDPKNPDAGSVRLVRLWAESTLAPFEKLLATVSHGVEESWHDYGNVTGLRHENSVLREQNDRLQIEQARLLVEADQARRLQALLDFKQRFIAQTLAAQVIGSSGSSLSRALYLDKGLADGLQNDMAVIVPAGVVGKVRQVFDSTSQMLLMNDAGSGVGAMLEQSRLYGVVKGSSNGELTLDHIMSDEKIQPGELVVTSGGDRIFPKGLPIGWVESVSPGKDLFLNIKIKPAADLNRLEEVLIITQLQGPQIETADSGPQRAADILAQRLPGLKPKVEANPASAPRLGNNSRASAPPDDPTTTAQPSTPQPLDTEATPKATHPQ
jgi:rod shape-determining protein MreC